MLLGSSQVDEPEVWSELGHAQLQHNNVAEAIAAYLRANDSSRCVARSEMFT